YDPAALYPDRRAGRCDAELEAAEAVIWNCCVSESSSHALLTALWAAEEHPVLRKVRSRIARDEAEHARFGWVYLDWLAPALGPTERHWLAAAAAKAIRSVEAGIAEVEKMPEVMFGRSSPIGGLGKQGYLDVARRSLDTRVRAPLAARGLGP